MRLSVLCMIVAVLLLEISCSDNNENPSIDNSEDSLIVAFLDSMNIDYQVDTSGIYYYPISLNPTGKTQAEGNVLSIYYQLDVLEGQNLITYDSTDGDPLRMKQGANAIYPVGIDHSLFYMKQGEEWVFIIPSNLSYPSYSSSLIPEGSILKFQASLKEIQIEDDIQFEDNLKMLTYSDSLMLSDTVNNPLNQPVFLSSGLIYKRLAEGTGNLLKPSQGDTVSITYRASLPYQEDNSFDLLYASNANPFSYSFNTGLVINGLDAGVAEMSPGEQSLLVIPSLLAYRESAIVLPDYLTDDMVSLGIIPSYASKVGPYEVLIFEVTLLQVN